LKPYPYKSRLFIRERELLVSTSIFRHFQVNHPNAKAPTIREVEEIQIIEDETSDKEDENDMPTSITINVRNLLLIKRSVHVIKDPYNGATRTNV